MKALVAQELSGASGLGEFINRTPGAQAEFGDGWESLPDGRSALESLANGGVRGKVVPEP